MPLMFVLPRDPALEGRRVRLSLMAVLSVTALATFGGCAGRDFSVIKPGIEQRGHYIVNVPFYTQDEDSCGPAALASVVSFWGQPVSLEEIKKKVYLSELRGTLPMDMERYLREAGFRTVSSSGTLEELKARVRENIPIICLLDLGFSVYRRPHYVTVIGFDDVNKVLITHDGVNANAVVGYEQFMKEWGRAGNWMVVALQAPLVREKAQ